MFCISFIPEVGNKKNNINYAVKIGNNIISLNEFENNYNYEIRQIKKKQLLFSKKNIKKVELQKQILEKLIQKELIYQYAVSSQFYISDEKVATTIKKIIFGQKTFNKNKYKNIIKNILHTTEKQFEKKIKKELMIAEVVKLLDSFIGYSEIELFYKFYLKNNKVKLNIIKINPLKSSANLNEDQIIQWGDKNKNKIEQYYNNNYYCYSKPKIVNVRHILIKIHNKKENEAKNQINNIKKILKNNKIFSTLAKKYSEDSTAKNGGSLGFSSFNEMMKLFSKKTFKLKEGEISDIVQTKFGYHLIKVDKIKVKSKISLKKSFNNVAYNLMQNEFIKKKIKKTSIDIINTLKICSFQNLNINKILNDVSLKSVFTKITTQFIYKNLDHTKNAGYNQKLLKEAFSLTNKNKICKKIIKVKDIYFIICLKEQRKPDLENFKKEKFLMWKKNKNKERQKTLKYFISFLRKNIYIKYNKTLFIF